MFNADDPVFLEAKSRAQQEARVEQQKFNGTAARERRKASRRAFAKASDAGAVAVAQERFADVLTGPTEAGLDSLSHGVKIREYTSEFTSQLVTATGEPYGLESSAPLTTDASADVAIDLSLAREGDGFGAAQPRDKPAGVSQSTTAGG